MMSIGLVGTLAAGAAFVSYRNTASLLNSSLGGIAATIVRIELMTPEGDLVGSETYNKLFTIHGISMIFFFLIPYIPADRQDEE